MYKKIKLSSGGYALIDSKDYKKLFRLKWRNHCGYAATGHSIMLMHRLIMQTPKGMMTDHINQNKLDNRRENLRIVNSQQNSFNKPKPKFINPTSIYKGVTKEKGKKFYRMSIKVKDKIVKINGFENAHYAALAYDLWAYDLRGNYAWLNFRKAV